MTIEQALRDAFRGDFQRDAPLAALTTFRMGGPAEFFVSVDSAAELQQAVTIARDFGVPVTVIGGGSNLLIADAGLRGLVVRVRGGEVRDAGDGLIRADAGVTINGLVRWTITHGRAGLEAWAGTPGTVGGAICGNAHFQRRNISEYVHQVVLLDAAGACYEVPAADMEFAYDYSRVQRTGEFIVAAEFRVRAGDPEQLRAVARESLAYRKRTQPLALPSAGCIFQNPDPAADPLPPGMPCSAGALVDRAGLKGAAHGAARVSPVHANFIVNEGGASAADVRVLIERCKQAVLEQYGVTLREEIVCLGFEGGPPGRDVSRRRNHGNTAD